MYKSEVMTRATLWLERHLDKSGPLVGHVCDFYTNMKVAKKMSNHGDAYAKFIKILEDIAWVNGCAVIIFPANMMEINEFHKLGYHFASKTFTTTTYDPNTVKNCKDE